MRRRTPIQIAVRNFEWQRLRESMLGTWKTSPRQNVKRLREYMGPAINDRCSPRFIRVYNYVTGSGFRIGMIAHSEIDALVEDLRKAARTAP